LTTNCLTLPRSVASVAQGRNSLFVIEDAGL
jgi:hypothetical protein